TLLVHEANIGRDRSGPFAMLEVARRSGKRRYGSCAPARRSRSRERAPSASWFLSPPVARPGAPEFPDETAEVKHHKRRESRETANLPIRRRFAPNASG